MKKRLVKISKFGSVTGIPRKTLIFYDHMNLIYPETIEKNGYRYYSYDQIDTASVVKLLCEIGVPLKEIREYLDCRSPEHFLALLQRQREHLEEEKLRLDQLTSLIDTRMQLTQDGLHRKSGEVIQAFCKEEHLFMHSELPPTQCIEEAWNYLSDFYEACENRQIAFGRPIGCTIKQEYLTVKGYHPLCRYYYTLEPNDPRANFKRPSGHYVIGYDYIGYGQTDHLYEKINHFIRENQLTVCGDIYTEYILDEMVTSDSGRYLAQVAVPVEQTSVAETR